MSRFINPVPQFFLNDGSLASSGSMKFFANKDYSTLKDTFSQPDNTIPNTNPLKLDGSGRLPPCFGEGLYSIKFYAYDPNEPDGLGALQWTRDDVSLSQLTGQFDSWSAIETYSLGDKVKASSGDYYESIQNGNRGNNPLTSPSYWSKVVFITEWNANVTYIADQIVVRLGKLYRSIAGGNLNNTPPSAQWEDLTFNNTITGDLTVSGTIYYGAIDQLSKANSTFSGTGLNDGKYSTFKFGDLISVGVCVQILSTMTTSTTSTAVIPSLYRPTTRFQEVIGTGASGALCRLRIETSGDILITRQSGTPLTEYFNFTLCYGKGF